MEVHSIPRQHTDQTKNSISITGLVCLGGNTSVADPKMNFRNSFEGTTGNGNGLANALVKITFAYSGYQNAFNVMNEIKNPVKTIKKSAPASLLIVAILYVLCNIAYFAAGKTKPTKHPRPIIQP